MKKVIILMFAAALLLAGCADKSKTSDAPDAGQSVSDFLLEKNEEYVSTGENSGDVSEDKRADTVENGQAPYAVVVTCSDSRVPPEHIFNAGIGELFVIRTAGNVIGDYELGSIEYGVEHLNAELVVILGHTQCGAVEAALGGGAHGYIKTITDEISPCLPENCDARQAEMLNVKNSIERVHVSEIIQKFEDNGDVAVVGAIYNISTGEVEFLD